MARSAKQTRYPAGRPAKRSVWHISGATVDGAVVVAVGTGAGVGFGYSPSAREWALAALGYGWIPVAGWIIVATVTLRYHPQSITRFWRRWVVSAALVAIAIGVLSFFSLSDGTLAEASLGGHWGTVVGGEPLMQGVLKLIGIAFLASLLLYPRQAGRSYLGSLSNVGRSYLEALRRVGLGLRYGAVYLYLGGYHAARFLGYRLRLLLNWRHRLRWVRMSLFWPFSAKTATIDASPAYSTPTELGEVPGPWADTEPGAISSEEPTKAPSPPEIEAGGGLTTLLRGKSKWPLPDFDLLSPAEIYDPPQAPLEQMARHIESTLSEHGVMVEVKDIKPGPRIVRFGLVPGWTPKRGELDKRATGDGPIEGSRVKVQSILSREKDLALALKTPYLRIEAPVPGEALVGLEVPTPSPSKVSLRGVMETPAFRKLAGKGGLPIALGQDTGGNPVVMDLTVLPHILIAGATGSGKSVCINSIVAAMLLTKPPDQLRMLMVDPKRVELTPFNGIPHLIAPVIVDVDEVNTALRALMREMFRRYKLMEETGTRNITGYNAKAKDSMPYLVLFVDELADLMMIGGFEVEQNLIRLAQLGRATGIHLVLATQRPSVNVVTGLLKANIVTRAAFAVASQVDSRVILDMVGSEKLLGKGDMLLLHNDSPKPRRVQGALVYDEEIDKLVNFWLQQKGPPLPVIPLDDAGDDEEDADEMDEEALRQARELALRNPRLSTSFLERRLKIGGRRATEIMDVLEDEGLVVRH